MYQEKLLQFHNRTFAESKTDPESASNYLYISYYKQTLFKCSLESSRDDR